MKLPHLDPFNAFVHRGSLKSPVSSKNALLKDWKIVVKDNITVSGWPLTCASRSLKEHIAAYNADIVESLLELGGEICGKANMDEFGMGSRGERSCYGPTLNPLDIEKSAGGSSGGCAAAVASGFCRLAVGSDTGGSVRLPASYTGTVGYKPTWGLISRYGLVSYAPSLDTVGLMARSVGDVITAFEGLVGLRGGWKDPTLVKMKENELESTDPLPLEGVTIGVLEEWIEDLAGISDHPLERIIKFIEAETGARLKLVSIPELKGNECLERYYEIACMEASSTLARYSGNFLKFAGKGEAYVIPNSKDYGPAVRQFQEENFGEEVFRRIERGRRLLCDSENISKTESYRERLKCAFDKIFKGECCDVLIGPTAFSSAPKLHALEKEKEDDLFTVPANLSGLPAISIPLHGLSRGTEGVIGTQLMAAHLDDRLLLRVARELEKVSVNMK